jgi:protein-S-isoprenylcysteine O-methyltransferase Ste14
MRKIPLIVVVVALVATVWLPFVNTSSLWFGLPSVMVWTAVWVALITLTLAIIEFTRKDDEEEQS